MHRLTVIAAIAAAALALAACGDSDDDTPAPAPTAEQAQPQDQQGQRKKPPPEPGTEITVGDSQFGEILFDGSNQAIYLFDKETSAEPQCYGDCAAAWPPVLTESEPAASGGAEAKLLGTTERDDGSLQVTYDGQPLYYYAHEGPGEVLCHNVAEFGGLWLVLDASGEALS